MAAAVVACERARVRSCCFWPDHRRARILMFCGFSDRESAIYIMACALYQSIQTPKVAISSCPTTATTGTGTECNSIVISASCRLTHVACSMQHAPNTVHPIPCLVIFLQIVWSLCQRTHNKKTHKYFYKGYRQYRACLMSGRVAFETSKCHLTSLSSTLPLILILILIPFLGFLVLLPSYCYILYTYKYIPHMLVCQGCHTHIFYKV